MKYRLKYNNKVANINIAVLFYKKLNIFVYYIYIYINICIILNNYRGRIIIFYLQFFKWNIFD